MSEYLDYIELPNGEIIKPVNDGYSYEHNASPDNWGKTGLPVVRNPEDMMNGGFNLPLARAVSPFIKMLIAKALQDGDFVAEVANGSSTAFFLDEDNQQTVILAISGVYNHTVDKAIRHGIFSDDITIYSLPKLIVDNNEKTDVTALFYGCSTLRYINPDILRQYNITDYTSTFEGCCCDTIKLPIGTGTSLNGTFYDSGIVNVYLTSNGNGKINNMYATFWGCDELEEISCDTGVSFAEVTNISGAFHQCTRLQVISGGFFKGLRISVSFVDSPLLTADSIKTVFNNIADLTGKEQQTIYLHPNAYAMLAEEDIAIATNKNWNVVETVTGEYFEQGGIAYEVVDAREVQVVKKTNNTKYAGDIEIPEYVTHNGTQYKVTCVGVEAFAGSTQLTSVKLPDTILFVRGGAFTDCHSLIDTTLPNSVIRVGGPIFMRCKSFKKNVLPNNLKVVRDMFLQECSNLESVTIPETVKFIGNYFVNGDSKLTEMICLSKVPPICTGQTFYGCSKTKVILKVPKDSKAAYENAYGWKDFTNIVELETAE